VARDRQSWYLTWGGRMDASGEIWQTGLHLALPTSGTPLTDPEADDADLVAEHVRTFHTAVDSKIGFQAYLDWVRLSRQGLDSKDLGPAAIAEYTEAQPGGGGSTTAAVAYQVAAVFSLRSGGTFGTANYGRCYYPQPIFPIAANGKWAPGQEPLINFRVMIDAINGTSFGNGVGSALQVSNMSAVGSGTTRKVVEVRLGDVPDTQRRRRNALTEVYQTQPIA